MGHRERLKDPADRLPGFGPHKQVEMVGHQAVTQEPEGIAILRECKCLKESEVVLVVRENHGAVVATVEGVVNQSVVDGSRKSSHTLKLIHKHQEKQLRRFDTNCPVVIRQLPPRARHRPMARRVGLDQLPYSSGRRARR